MPPPASGQGRTSLPGWGFYQLQVQGLTEAELGELAPCEFLPCVCPWLTQCQGLFFPGPYQDTKPSQGAVVSLWRAPDDMTRIQPVLSEVCPEKESPPFPH